MRPALSISTAAADHTSVNLELDYQTSLTFPDLLQFRIFNSVQGCQAVQLTIQDLGPWTPGVSRALELNALDLVMGMKRGAAKLGPNASVA